MRIPLTLIVLSLLIAGCSANAQYSSGKSYLSRYEAVKPAKQRRARIKQNRSFSDQYGRQVVVLDNSNSPSPVALSLDAAVREAADVEPILQFPANIGIARIANGRLSRIPAAEGELLFDALGEAGRYGTFVPVDPATAALAKQSITEGWQHDGTMATIRIGAARQHLDAVLVYEVGARGGSWTSGLGFADLTIIGGAILPTRSLEAQAIASATLIDVRNGYRYGSADAQESAEALTPSWGSDREKEKLRDAVALAAVDALVPEVLTMFELLEREMRRAGR